MSSEQVVELHEPWATQEELLLAYAVNRYGEHSWDSVAAEIQSRIPRFHLLTPFHFQHKFHDLNRRFLHLHPPPNSALIPWLHHLRQLRLSQLRLQVQNHDTSIISLQSKLRKLEEEGERMSRDSETIPDLKIRISGGSNRRVSDEQRLDPKTGDDESAPANQDDQPFNESDSAHIRSDSVGVPVRSSEKEGIAGEPPEQGEAAPVTETESSTDVSFFDTVVQMESRPLDEIFDALITHPLCSLFSRQLDEHEKERYVKLIREPIDLEIIRGRVEQGKYNFCRRNFFRDILLLFNNAILFFDGSSPEFAAAVDLRRLFPQAIPPLASVASTDGVPPREPQEAINPLKTLPVPVLPISRRRSSLAGKPPPQETVKTKEEREEGGAPAEEVLASVLEWKKPIRAVMKRRSRERRRSAVLPEREEKGDGSVVVAGEEEEETKGGGINRIKERSGSGNNGTLLETLKGLSEVCGGGTREGKGGRGQKEEQGQGEKVVPRKRGVGRPPKKALPQTPAAGTAGQKRLRETGVEGDETIQSQRCRKRLRK